MSGFPGALALATRSLSASLRPSPPTPFRDWLPKNIVLVDGPKKGEFWSAADAPYLPEIADCLSQEHPCNLVTVRKGQQTGASILGLAWTLYLAEIAPDNVLYAVPGLDALQDINSQKLQPLIDVSQAKTGKRIIVPITSRSGRGSTTYEKRFPGGVISLANANVATELSMKTIRFGVKDELSKWIEIANADDPEVLFFGRFTSFRRQKTYKILEISTPEFDSGDELGEGPGHCRIDRSFRRSDQRFFHVGCPGCRARIVLGMKGFQIDREHPHKSYFLCSCGAWIDESERIQILGEGHFIPTFRDEPDRHPGFHVDAFISKMMSFEAIAEDRLSSEKKGEAGAKNFANLVLALPFAMRGNAPDHQRLMERREDYPRRVVPVEGLIVTAGADVQHYGIWVETVAFAEDRQSWSVDVEFIEGPTVDPNAGAWLGLEAYLADPLKDAFGQDRKIEAMAVDSGDAGRTQQVYEWCRRHAGAYAIKGQGGRGVPPISVPRKVSVTRRGARQRFGSAQVWSVGTWGLKAELYGNLHRAGVVSGADADPSGYCHFGRWQGEEYFKQLTAEYFSQKLLNGRLREEWRRIRQDNHLLDCRIYAMAMAEHLGLSRLTKDGWARLRALVHPAPDVMLFSPASHRAEDGTIAVAASAQTVEMPAPVRKRRFSIAEASKQLNG